MKTYINVGVSYKEAPIEREVNLSGLNEYLEKHIKHVTRKYKRQENVQEVQKGDVVTLCLESPCPKLNRSSLKLSVGLNMFDEDLERHLIGLNVSQPEEMIVHGESVKVTVIESLRILFPEVNDEMIKEYVKNDKELKDIQTVDEYKKYFIEKYKKEVCENLIGENMSQIIDYVMTHTDWEFDEEEVQHVKTLYIEEINQELKEEGKILDKLSKDELKLLFDVEDLDDFYKNLQSMAEYGVACALFQIILNGKNPQDYTFEQAQDLGWDVLENYVKTELSNIF